MGNNLIHCWADRKCIAGLVTQLKEHH